MVGHGSDDHHGRGYNILVTKTGCIITRTRSHVKSTPITLDEYLQSEVSKRDTVQRSDKYDEVVNYYTKLYQHKKQEKSENSNYDPVMSTWYIEPSPMPSFRRTERQLEVKGATVKISESTSGHITCTNWHEKQSLKQNQEK